MHAARSGPDIAFWDTTGKTLNLPVYALFGGWHNERIRVSHNPWDPAIESMAECTSTLIAECAFDPLQSDIAFLQRRLSRGGGRSARSTQSTRSGW